jgi:hypothetical protein
MPLAAIVEADAREVEEAGFEAIDVDLHGSSVTRRRERTSERPRRGGLSG